jgi:peroxiredoxin
MAGSDFQDLLQTIECALTQSGERLVKLSEASPVLLVFLRHAGCTFCREALWDIARTRSAIEGTGIRIILVHMRDSQAIEKLLERYGLSGVDRIFDPDQKLYRAFGLKRGNLRQLFGPKVLWRGFQAGVLARHGIGRLSADRTQMPGLFLIDHSIIVRRFRHRTAADRPDYAGICAPPSKSESRL